MVREDTNHGDSEDTNYGDKKSWRLPVKIIF